MPRDRPSPWVLSGRFQRSPFVFRAGGVVMPLDLQLETETLRRILEDSRPAAVFTISDYHERIQDVKPNQTRVFHLENPPETDAPSAGEGFSSPDRSPEDLAALFYTSGTTGPPKGVPLRHRNLAFQLNAIQKTGLVRPDDRIMLPLPPHHVYPFVIAILMPLALGLTLVLPHSRTGPQLVRALREGEATLLMGVSRLYEALFSGIVDRIVPGAATRRLFHAILRGIGWVRKTTGRSPGRLLFRPLHDQFAPRLRIMASGGAPLDPELGWKLEALGWPVAIGYGLTETSPLLTIKVPGDPRLETVGRAVEGVRLRIDPKALPESAREGAAAGTGEILAKGPNVFPGYHNLPEKTEETFTEDGWFRTGDLGVLDDDGYLRVTGRVSTLIVTPGGENIQPDEIEGKISANPLIQEAGVLQTESGELAALIVPDVGEMRGRGIRDIDSAAREALSEISRALPSYRRIQESAVTRSALPRTRLGKIRRHLLAERYREAGEEKASGKTKRSGPIAFRNPALSSWPPTTSAIWTRSPWRRPWDFLDFGKFSGRGSAGSCCGIRFFGISAGWPASCPSIR